MTCVLSLIAGMNLNKQQAENPLLTFSTGGAPLAIILVMQKRDRSQQAGGRKVEDWPPSSFPRKPEM